MSLDILVVGLLTGLPYGLLAVGLVLVYRSSRFLRLHQAALCDRGPDPALRQQRRGHRGQ